MAAHFDLSTSADDEDVGGQKNIIPYEEPGPRACPVTVRAVKGDPVAIELLVQNAIDQIRFEAEAQPYTEDAAP